MLLDGELLALGCTRRVNGILEPVLGWPVADVRILDILEAANASLLPAYLGTATGDLRLEFWIEDAFYEVPASMDTPSRSLVDAIQQRRITARDRLQLVRYGFDSPAIELTPNDAWNVTFAAAIIDDVRLRGLVPCISPFHAHPGVRADKEMVLLALCEPGQMAGALHILRPTKVIP